MSLYGKNDAAATTPLVTGPVPATPAERVLAVKAELTDQGIGGAAAQGRSVTPGDVRYAVAAVEHFLPDAGERRALCRQMAADLRSMVLIGAIDAAEIDDVLGVTAERFGETGVPEQEGVASRGFADDALRLAEYLAVGHGRYVDRWSDDDDYVAGALAVLFVVFTRLAV